MGCCLQFQNFGCMHGNGINLNEKLDSKMLFSFNFGAIESIKSNKFHNPHAIKSFYGFRGKQNNIP